VEGEIMYKVKVKESHLAEGFKTLAGAKAWLRKKRLDRKDYEIFRVEEGVHELIDIHSEEK
jgi:hypothetical protein